jgi:tetratricopeptide (TPR) repeat protein
MKLVSALAALALPVICAPAALAQTPTEDEVLKAALVCYNFDDDDEKPDVLIAACTTALRDPTLDKEDRLDMLFGRALAYSAAKKPVEALADYDEMIRIDPKYADAYGNRGNIHQFQYGDYNKAIADYDAALAIRPHQIDFGNRGVAYLEGDNDYAKAIADFDASIGMDASNASVWGYRCWAKTLRALNLDQAIADCDKSLSLGVSDVAWVTSSRAIANYKWKKYQAAWNDFDAALNKAPNNPEFLYGRGISAMKIGKAIDGAADIAKAQMDEPDIEDFFADYGITRD